MIVCTIDAYSPITKLAIVAPIIVTTRPDAASGVRIGMIRVAAGRIRPRAPSISATPGDPHEYDGYTLGQRCHVGFRREHLHRAGSQEAQRQQAGHNPNCELHVGLRLVRLIKFDYLASVHKEERLVKFD